MTQLEQLVDLISLGGNLVMLGRSMAVHHPNLHQWVIEHTLFLPANCSFNERAYCLVNDIRSIPLCSVKNAPCRFINYFKGYQIAKPPKQPKPTNTGAKDKTHQQLLIYAQMVGSNSASHGSKVKAFLERNKDRNTGLYELPDDRVNIDFVVCPVLGVRTLNIKKKYIEGVLLMSVDEFKAKYLSQALSCSGLTKAISDGLLVIDEETNKTKHQISVEATKATLSMTGADGLTGYKRKGEATKATHMKNIDEFGRNGYSQLAAYRNETICDNGKTVQQNALVKNMATRFERGASTRRSASIASKIQLQPVIDWLEANQMKYYFDMKEYAIYDSENSRYYFYDLVIPECQLCVEYQSNAFHPNVHLVEMWDKWKPALGRFIAADDKYKYDINKAKLLFTKRGFRTWFLWEGYEDVALLMQFLKDSRKDETQ